MPYTPFLTQAGAAIGRGLESRGLRQQKEAQNRMAGSAYMGDPQAMEELMQVNPQLGMQIQQQAQKRADTQKQKLLTEQTGFKKDFEDLSKNIATYPDYASAKEYAESEMGALKLKYPLMAQQAGADEGEFDEEMFGRIKQFEAEGEVGGAFAGTSMDAQVSNMLTKGVEDPEFRNSSDYARAWQLANEPKVIRTPSGDITMRPELPDIFKPPGVEATKEPIPPEQVVSDPTQTEIPGAVKPTFKIPGTEKISADQKDYNKDYLILRKSHLSMQNYIDVLGELGPQMAVGPLNAKDTQRISSAYSRAMLDAKETNNLGVLNGPDLSIMRQLLGDPAGIGGQIRGKEALQAGAEEAKKQIMDNFNALNEIFTDTTVGLKELEKAKEKPTKKTDIPEVGAAVGDYKFIGGDPSKPESWEKIQ